MYNREKNELNKDIGKILTEEYLREAVKTLPNLEIARIHNCSGSVVRKYLFKYNIKCFNSRKGRKPPTFIEGDWFRNNRYFVWDESRHKRIRRYVYVMEQHIGKEINSRKFSVHHLNGIPTDDRIENLVLMLKRDHDKFHMILRNKHIKCDDTWTATKVMETIYPLSTNEMKRYAELTRMIRCKKNCKK